MTGNGLRPQAESAARLAATAGIHRQVGVLQVADEIVFDDQIALVHVDHRRQRIHVFDNRAVGVAHIAFAVAPGDAAHFGQRFAFGNFHADVIEFTVGDEVDGLGSADGGVRIDRHMRADHTDEELGIFFLQRLGNLAVVLERRRAGVKHGKLEVAGHRHHFFHGLAVGGGINQFAVRDHRGRLRQPRGIPERADFAAGLIARAGATVKAVERRRIQKQRFHSHDGSTVPFSSMWPCLSTLNS